MPTVRMSPEKKKIAAQHSPQTLPRRRRFLFALFAIFFVPVLALALLEVILRLSGFGYPTSFLLKEEQGGVTVRGFFLAGDRCSAASDLA